MIYRKMTRTEALVGLVGMAGLVSGCSDLTGNVVRDQRRATPDCPLIASSCGVGGYGNLIYKDPNINWSLYNDSSTNVSSHLDQNGVLRCQAGVSTSTFSVAGAAKVSIQST